MLKTLLLCGCYLSNILTGSIYPSALKLANCCKMFEKNIFKHIYIHLYNHLISKKKIRFLFTNECLKNNISRSGLPFWISKMILTRSDTNVCYLNSFLSYLHNMCWRIAIDGSHRRCMQVETGVPQTLDRYCFLFI